MNQEKIRADVALVGRGLVQSRERAQSLITGGFVTLNGTKLNKSSVKVGEDDILTVHGQDHPYVSRGGLKLEKALNVFQIDPSGLVCMDIGASTGGFTDVLLQNGAKCVYAIDVGTGQLDPVIASDRRVISMEHTNARELHTDMFPVPPVLAVMDVSFISISLILPAAFQVLGPQGRMVSLIKPQFEAGPANLGKKGVVSDPRVHVSVLQHLVEFAGRQGWSVRKLDYSPISGGSGNIEFLGDFVHAASADCAPPTLQQIRDLVKSAHQALK